MISASMGSYRGSRRRKEILMKCEGKVTGVATFQKGGFSTTRYSLQGGGVASHKKRNPYNRIKKKEEERALREKGERVGFYRESIFPSGRDWQEERPRSQFPRRGRHA